MLLRLGDWVKTGLNLVWEAQNPKEQAMHYVVDVANKEDHDPTSLPTVV